MNGQVMSVTFSLLDIVGKELLGNFLLCSFLGDMGELRYILSEYSDFKFEFNTKF